MRIVWLVVVVLAYFLAGGLPLIAADTIKSKCKQLEGTLKNANCEISISGPLFGAQLLNPGDSLYSCQETIITNIQTPLVKDGYKHIMTNNEYYHRRRRFSRWQG